MIDKEAPILAFDVSKGSSHCQGYCSFGKPSSKPIKVAHTKSGLAAAEGISEALEEKTGTKPKVVMESTGVYSKPVMRWAESLGLEVYLISPLESAKVRKSRVRPTKTDALDCGVIAEVAYTRSLRRATPRSSLYSQLYSLSRRRAAIADRLVASKNQYRKSLDCVWPLLDEASDPFSGYAMWAVGKYRHPERLAKAKGKSIVSGLERAKARTGAISKTAIASKLIAYAKDALSGCSPNDGEVDGLMSAVKCKIIFTNMDEITFTNRDGPLPFCFIPDSLGLTRLPSLPSLLQPLGVRPQGPGCPSSYMTGRRS